MIWATVLFDVVTKTILPGGWVLGGGGGGGV